MYYWISTAMKTNFVRNCEKFSLLELTVYNTNSQGNGKFIRIISFAKFWHFYMASIFAYLKMLFGALVEKGWVKNMKIHSSLNSNLLLWKKLVITLCFLWESSFLSKLWFNSFHDFNTDSQNFEKILKSSRTCKASLASSILGW